MRALLSLSILSFLLHLHRYDSLCIVDKDSEPGYIFHFPLELLCVDLYPKDICINYLSIHI